MEYIDELRDKIRNNSNLSEEFKCNLGTLTDTIVTVLPEYDYSNLSNVLSNLDIVMDNELESYSKYDKNNNVIKLNIDKIFNDRIDLQHLMLNELLLRSSTLDNEALEGFNIGLTEAISSTMNTDESMVKLNPLEYTLTSLFSKVVDGKILMNNYFNGDISNIAFELESKGINNEDFVGLLSDFNKVRTNDSSFVDAELLLIEMYQKKVDFELKNNSITYDDISNKFDDFSELLIQKRSELISIYPHYDFSNLNGFEKINEALTNAVVKVEEKEEEKTK